MRDALPREERRRGDRRQGRLHLVAPEPLPPPSDEPAFLRPNRRVRHRRARGWPARAVVALQTSAGVLIAAWALSAGYARVMASDRLKVNRIDVRGARFLSEGEVRGLLGPALGENILALDLEALKSRLRASSWVAEAAVVRSLPDTLRVEIRERAPLALAELERLYLMDAEGALIDVYGPRTAGFDLPIVRGLWGVTEDERKARAARAAGLVRELAELASEVSEVAVDGRGDGVRVVLRGAGEALLMGSPPYRRKLVDFLALRRELAARCPAARTFDVRFRARIYVGQCEAVAEPVVPPAEVAPTPAEPPPSAEASPETAPPAAMPIPNEAPSVSPPSAAPSIAPATITQLTHNGR